MKVKHLWSVVEISSNVVIDSNEEQEATLLGLRGGAKALNVHSQPTHRYSIKWQRATEGDSHALLRSRQ